MPNFVLPTPTLEHLALVKTAAVLWNHHAIPEMSNNVGSMREVGLKWTGIEERVKADALALELTQPCKRDLNFFIESLGLEIAEWCCYHYIDYNNDENQLMLLKCYSPPQLCWTMHGVIDYAKTARLMMKDERIDVETRYEIACLNCFADEIQRLIKFVPESKLEEYSDRLIRDITEDHRHLITLFTCALRRDAHRCNSAFREILPNFSSLTHYLFIKSLYSGCRGTCEYFFANLNQQDKEKVLGSNAILVFRTQCSTIPRNNLLYYLSLMNAEQRERLCRECMDDVLLCFVRRWPMKLLFVETARRGWHYMNACGVAKVNGCLNNAEAAAACSYKM